jgi:GNAT superfamily N-acetyltransferase
MIRAASSLADFETCAAIFNDVAEDERISARDIAEADGATVLLHGEEGYVFAKPSSVAGSTFAMVRVRPAARRRGVGSALLAALPDGRMWGRVHDEGSLAFATSRGFREAGRDIPAMLRVDAGGGARRDDIVELREEHLPGAYAVVAEAMPETALPMIAAARPYEEWLESERRPGRAATFVALDGGEVVGYAALTEYDGMPHRLENGITAVRKSHRRRGIAVALKRAQIAWAAEHGYTEIVSEMVEGNVAMRAVNRALGFVELPAWIAVER